MTINTRKLTHLGRKVSVEACSPHDEPAEDEGDAQQGEQTATCGALGARWSNGQLRVLNTNTAIGHYASHNTVSKLNNNALD